MHLCECGCGQPTNVYTYNDTRTGAVKGQYARFVRGHNPGIFGARGTGPNREMILADVLHVLAMTECHQHPTGDHRSSTYFEQGKYSREALYKVFGGGWSEILKIVYPQGISARSNSIKIVKEPAVKYTYKQRNCLQCGKAFKSWGPGNWKCIKCRNSVTHLEGGEDERCTLALPSARSFERNFE